MSIDVRPATIEDVGAVVAIEKAAFSDPWSENAFHEALSHPAVFFACARCGGDDIAGYVVAWFAADEGEIANLAVSPIAWGGGVGRALLTSALDVAASRGASAVYLEVRDSNERARRLYRSSGFEEVGRRRRYYRHPVEDAIVLRRTMTKDV
jgi:ribosomal-protein-alanine N-acetyltransferase